MKDLYKKKKGEKDPWRHGQINYENLEPEWVTIL